MHFPDYDSLHKRQTLKWTRYPDDVIPLWVAESDFATCDVVKQAVKDAVEREYFGYPGDNPGVIEATQDFYQHRYGYRPPHVGIVADVVRGLQIGIQHFTRPDSAVVVPVPAYPPFFQLLHATGREGIFLDARNKINLDDLREAFKSGAGSVIVCNPFNPAGYVYSADELEAICAVADEYQARVLVDEIHAPLVFDGTHHVAASLNDTAARVCFTVTATSKAWNTAGLKCAQILFSNPNDWEIWNSLTNATKDGASTLGMVAAEAAYREGIEFLEEELEYLRVNRDYLLSTLPEVLPGVKITAPQATYLLWMDLSATAIPGNKSEFLLTQAKVALNDGAWFGELGKDFVRLNFATSRDILEQAISRIGKAVAAL